MVIKQREAYALFSFSYDCSCVSSELSVVLIVVSVNRCGLSCFCFLVFRKTSCLFSLSPHLASLPHLRADECGEAAAYGCSVGLAACRAADRQRWGVDKSVRGSAQFYPSTAPKQRQIILSNTKAKSTAFERRLCSCRRNAPKRKLTNTLLRRVMDTTAMSAPGTDSA